MKSSLKIALISLLAGALYPLGFAPFSWWPLSLISVAVIFYTWQRLPLRGALWSALCYGLAAYGVGVSWVYVSMVTYGNMAPAMAVIAVALFASYLSLYFIVPVFIFHKLAPMLRERHRLTILLPSLWVVFEWLRGTLFTGFAWLFLGYSAVGTWFSGWASIAGVLAASFLLAYFAGLAAWLMTVRNREEKEIRQRFKPLYIVILLVAVSWGVSSLRWAEQSGPMIDVTLIQADIPLSEKWRPENRENIMQTYLAASRAITDTDLIVWPEAALPMTLQEVPEIFYSEVSKLDAGLVSGVVERERENGAARLYNSLALFSADSAQEAIQSYRKRHLVPFGEFFPLQNLLGWLFATLEIPMSDFGAGPAGQGNLSFNGFNMLPTICYEDAYPEDWRSQVAAAHAIVNVSEDAWFGDSLGPHQRLQMARMRAIEFQRPVIRVSNNGLSTVIDEYGQTEAVSPQFQPALFTSPVAPMQGETPYAQYGQWPLWSWLLVCLLFAVVQRRTRVACHQVN